MLTGNEDRETVVLHFLAVPLVTRYLRFLPQKWENMICMRVEIYGCGLSKFIITFFSLEQSLMTSEKNLFCLLLLLLNATNGQSTFLSSLLTEIIMLWYCNGEVVN